ncbi:MAG: extracellular solute-binding protein, partial [Deinococcota bacterium]|nr:extracellular solute-binding protein [Deinococcota bacterium]
ARATAEGSGDRYSRVGYALSPAGQDHHLIREVLIRQFGGVPYSEDAHTVSYDDEAGAQALGFYTSWQREENIGVVDFFPGANGYRDAFKQGLAAMIVDGSFAVGQMQEEAQVNWAVAELPVDAATGTQSNFGSYWAHGITRNATGEKLEAAARFVQFITSEEAMRYWLTQVGEIPARTALAAAPEYAEDPIYGPFIASLPYAHSTFFVDEAGQRQVMLDAVNRVLLEGMDPQASLAVAAQEEQAMLDAFWQGR